MVQKFVVVVGGWWWICKPISVLSFDQAEQFAKYMQEHFFTELVQGYDNRVSRGSDTCYMAPE